MAEYSKEKLYFLKLDKDFFKSYDIQIIEKSSPKGKDIILFLIKLMCESTSHQGYLRFSEELPYDNQMLSCITNTDLDVVDEAMKLFKKLKIVKTTKDKTIFIPKVEEMTLSRTEGALKKEEQKKTKGGTKVEKIPPQGGTKVENVPLDNKILDIRYKILDSKNNINNKKIINSKTLDKKKTSEDFEVTKDLIKIGEINSLDELYDYIEKQEIIFDEKDKNELIKLLLESDD